MKFFLSLLFLISTFISSEHIHHIEDGSAESCQICIFDKVSDNFDIKESIALGINLTLKNISYESKLSLNFLLKYFNSQAPPLI